VIGEGQLDDRTPLQNDLSLHNVTYEDAIEMVLHKPLWGLLAASGATH